MAVKKLRGILFANGEKTLVLGLVGFLFLVTVLIGWLSKVNNAYAVLIDGETVALVADGQEAEEVLAKLVEAKERETGQAVQAVQQVEIVKLRQKGDKLSAAELVAVLADRLEFTTAGVAIVIDGEKKMIVENRQVAEKLLQEAKEHHLKGQEGIEVVSIQVEEDVELVTVEIGLGEYMDYDTALNLLVNGVEKVEKHRVVSGESLWTIARANNMQVEDLMEANPQLTTERLQIDQELNLVKLEPMINVVATLRQSIKESIPFQTKYTNNSDLYRGQEKVTQPGQRGEREVVYELVQKNGVTVEKNELEARVVSEPVDRVVSRGTKVLVASRGNGEAGKFGWPVNGRVTSGYGKRSGGFHSGVDIAASAGTSIRAVAAGTVIFSGYSGAYGNMIDIDHGNGVVTRYAHNSANLVSVGKKVSAGEVIARVGTTGRATGPHVHFEVRINGQTKNPLHYLP